MNCPIDGTELRITDRQGVEIDYCPKCRGVWLDRGELDKLIERSTTTEYRERDYDDDDDRKDRYGHSGHAKHRKQESFWSRMFDFD